jgi:antirestriction protein ArdC
MVFRSACAYTEGPGLTFRQALALGGHVRKGEKGTTVVYADPSALWLAPAAAPRVAGDPELIPFRQPSFDQRVRTAVWIVTRPGPRPRH